MRFTTDSHFAASQPHVRTIYDTMLAMLRDFGPVTEMPKQSAIYLVNTNNIAAIYPRKSYMNLEFKSDAPIDSPRITKGAQLSKNRYAYYVKLTEVAEIDAELLAWLKGSYDLAGGPVAKGWSAPDEGIPDTAEEFIDHLAGDQKPIGKSLVALIRADLTGASESIKWGAPTWSLGKKHVCNVIHGDDYVGICFFNAGALPDPEGVLHGSGVSLRYIKLQSFGARDQALVRRYIRAAVELAKG